MKTIVLCSDSEKILKTFREHLLSTQGLNMRTCMARVFYTREFLNRQFRAGPQKLRPEELTPEVLLNYVLERSRQDSPQRLQALASALRAFGRFLRLSGRSHCDLTAALPRIASIRRPCMPDYLRPEQLKHLLGSMHTGTPSGRRNYAIILCLARLGLRAGEVAALRLDDIQWRTGVVCLCGGKGRRDRQLPLPKDVGRAIANYLCARPEPANSRRVFCGLRNGKALSSMAISQVARRALQRAGLQMARPGAHLLRRTLASHLIQQGATLKAVADILGHRCLDTTRVYANVNHSMLAEVARPWPSEVSR